MRARWIRFSPIVLVLFAAPAVAQEVMALVRGDRWAEADLAAAQFPDPVARKLVTYYRLLAPNAASTAEIAAFMANSPDWPQQATLRRRRDEALAVELDDAQALQQCDQSPPAATAARSRCTDAYRLAGRPADAMAMLRRAWIEGTGDAAWEAHFLQFYNATPSRDDQWRRFDRLAWTDAAAAQRQMARLDPTDQARAGATLAFRRDDPAAAALLAGVPAAQRGDPGLVFAQLRALRRADQDDAALALWASAGGAAERAAAPERLAAFWDERNILARRRLRVGDNAGAYALASGHAQRGGEQIVDAEFLAGFIALRRLNDPALAAKHFQALAVTSGAAITQGRAHYWLGRAAAAHGDAVVARAEYAEAAKWPNTFYGQLAAVALGDDPSALGARIRATHDPAADATRALDLAGRELARAAAYLVSWGEAGRAQPFLLRLEEVAPDAADQALTARLAAGFGLPETAIAIARRAGRNGVVLIDTGWPMPAAPPPAVEPALSLGVIRQESSFDPTTTSPAGARGLMQLMPATAGTVARQLGLPSSVPALTLDPAYNMRLGTAYLEGLLDQFSGSVPLAVAGYNAGPGRVLEWIGTNGDPSGVGVDIIDWIELIPFGETRNYVQRVIENQVIYRAKRGEILPHPLARWLR